MRKIGFLGVGKMGEAILASLISKADVKPVQIVACDAVKQRREEIKRQYDVVVTDDPVLLAEQCETLLLAVKPQDLDAILETLAPLLTKQHLLISIAAGKTVARLQSLSGGCARIVRVMPNLNVRVGAGMSVFTLGPTALADDRHEVTRLLTSCGDVLELAEEHFDVVTALSGSGPAFFAFLMQAMTQAAEKLGLSAAAANLLANQTMLGTACYLKETQQNPAEFIEAVCSRGGTTAAGMSLLQPSPVAKVLADTLAAAAQRSRELNKG